MANVNRSICVRKGGCNGGPFSSQVGDPVKVAKIVLPLLFGNVLVIGNCTRGVKKSLPPAKRLRRVALALAEVPW